jgi:AcrR family transcriptional regulator
MHLCLYMQDGTNMPRGRPREFDEAATLDAAMDLFWTRGFSSTSLDDLAEATGLNRPSLYNAFGNKLSLYRRAFGRFAEKMRSETRTALLRPDTIQQALLGFYDRIVRIYMQDPARPGCLVFCTAPAEAASHPVIAQDLQALIREIDRVLEMRFEVARGAGQLPDGANVRALAAIAQGLVHSLAIRARAGDTEAQLRKFVRESVAALLGKKDPR